MRQKPKIRANSPARADQESGPFLKGRHRWRARLVLVVGAPVLLLTLFELLLRLSDFGYPSGFFLPREINGRAVWVQNDRFAWRFLTPALARQPFPTVIPRNKPAGTMRIFVLGESAAYGDPQPEFGLARVLEALLRERYPQKRFEVINVSLTAINSHVILPLARDCARIGGDAFVVYMGNNEVVGPFGAGTVFGAKGANLTVARLSLALKTTRIGQLLDLVIGHMNKNSAKEWGGMQMFMNSRIRQRDPKMRRVYDNFAENLNDIITVGRRNGIKLAVGTVGTNLKDCAPFASLHRLDLGTEELDGWNQLYKEATEAMQKGDFILAADGLEKAAKVDDSFAELQFVWGKCLLALGRTAEARQHLTRARDEDALRFRADTRLNEIIRELAAGHEKDGVGFVDTTEALAQASPDTLPGSQFFYEHVHLTFEGNYLLARAFANQIAALFPSLAAQGTNTSTPWPSVAACAKRLGWSDWTRYEAEQSMFARLSDPPFTGQFGHEQQYSAFRADLERLKPAKSSAGLREAEHACRAALDQDTNDWVLKKQMATVLERESDFTAAASLWREVTTLLPQYSEAWQALGHDLVEAKNDASAREAFETALRLDPSSTIALTGLGEVLSRQGDRAGAIRCFERSLKLKPYWGPGHLGLGKCLEKLGRREEAEVHFHQALQNRIYTPAGLKGLAAFCFEHGWYDAAVTNFAAALKLDPLDSATELNLGMTLGLLGRNPEATVHYTEAVRLDPNLAEAHVRLGFELGRQADDAGALEHFAKAVQLKPDLLEARLDLGIALLNQHRPSDALAEFKEVLRRDPRNQIALRHVSALGAAPRQ